MNVCIELMFSISRLTLTFYNKIIFLIVSIYVTAIFMNLLFKSINAKK